VSSPADADHRQTGCIIRQRRRKEDRIHPAWAFQACGCGEQGLAALENVLPPAVSGLKPTGRLAVISFHSLEDRIVKDFFRSQSRDLVNPPYERIYEQERKAVVREIARKPILPSPEEIHANPRARSAKLRIVEKL
jgi:16S rRNA (cytosine1402-N4)-methyltransferase